MQKKIILSLLFGIAVNQTKTFDYVQCLSVPRSGHHLLIHVLFKYFREIKHPIYGESKKVYCNFFDCCQTTPCKNGKLVLKNHDLELNVPFSKNVKYIVQYRQDPIVQFRAEQRKRTELKHINPMTFHNFLNYTRWGVPRILYWKNFVLKNINNNPYPENTYFLEYYDLVQDPFFHIKAILETIFEEPSVNEEVLKTIIKRHQIKVGHHYSGEDYDFLKHLLPKPQPSEKSLSEMQKKKFTGHEQVCRFSMIQETAHTEASTPFE